MKEVTLSEVFRSYMNNDSQIIGGEIIMFGEEYANGIPITDNEKLNDFLKGKVKGIINAPIYDREYFKVGDVLRVTPTEKLQYKVSGWQSRPNQPFNAIIIDVIPDKLMIVYYTPSTRKLCGRYAIPAEWVSDGFIKIEKIMGA